MQTTPKLLATLRIIDVAAYNALGRPFDAYRLQQHPQQPRKHRRTVVLALLLLLLASCTTTRPATMPERSQRVVVEHDQRARTAEPTPSRIK